MNVSTVADSSADEKRSLDPSSFVYEGREVSTYGVIALDEEGDPFDVRWDSPYLPAAMQALWVIHLRSVERRTWVEMVGRRGLRCRFKRDGSRAQYLHPRSGKWATMPLNTEWVKPILEALRIVQEEQP